jgi:CubicO group peptidase (beta-lactamase class C family)
MTPRWQMGRVLAAAFAACTILTSVVCAQGTIQYPATRAGEIARAYFEAFNSGDPEKLSVFEETYRSAGALEKRPVDQRVPRLLALREQTGNLEPAKVLNEKPNSLTITVHAVKADMWANCTFSIEEEAPYKLVSVAIMPGAAPEDEKAYAKEWKNLADLLEQIRAKTGAPAIVAAIIQGERLTDLAVVGERWVGSGQPVERSDAFHVGSVTKSMTATMVGALVEKEILSWDLTIGDILVGVEMRDEYREVTIEQLMQHRGGLPGYTNIGEEEEKRLAALPGSPTRQREAFVAQVLMETPVATPGTEMNYSNAGYTVVAFMAERVSARSWEELMQTHLFDIAGMKGAGFGWPATPEHPDQPRGHFKEGDHLRPQKFGEYELGPFIAPAGDVHCSIDDLALYAVVHMRGLAGRDKVFLAETIQRLHEAPPVVPGEMGYAAGWAIVESPEVGVVHVHSGSAGTFMATIELYPEYNAAVVLATNADLGIGTAVSSEITDLVKQRMKEQGQAKRKEQ